MPEIGPVGKGVSIAEPATAICGGVLLNGHRTDLRIIGDTVVEVGEIHLRDGDRIIDLAGGTVLPGLHDHHIHLRAQAAAITSVQVGPAAVAGRDGLRSALRKAASAHGWVRAVGYHESVAGELDRDVLDELIDDRPVRIQHRSGAMWFVNSRGLELLGRAEHTSGRLFRQDHSLVAVTGDQHDLSSVSRQLAAFGVTGVSEATPGLTEKDVASLREELVRNSLRQRLHVLRGPTGAEHPRLSFGAVKRIIDDDIDLSDLTRWIARQHDDGSPVAIHCVTVLQLVVTITALRTAGSHSGDRIEHAAVVPDELLADLHDLGITVVTQPGFIAERGEEYLVDVPIADHNHLWRLGGFTAASVPVAGSTDAPFGSPDPWAAMRAARDRATVHGRVIGLREALAASAAIGLFLGSPQSPAVPRRIEPGMPADLCLLSVPPAQALADLSAAHVAYTVISGDVLEIGL